MLFFFLSSSSRSNLFLNFKLLNWQLNEGWIYIEFLISLLFFSLQTQRSHCHLAALFFSCNYFFAFSSTIRWRSVFEIGPSIKGFRQKDGLAVGISKMMAKWLRFWLPSSVSRENCWEVEHLKKKNWGHSGKIRRRLVEIIESSWRS